MFWIIVAILTAFVALVLIWPLARKSSEQQVETASEIAIYQDQLRELDRERESGLIGETEAEYARAEIGRRLLNAAEKSTTVDGVSSSKRINRWVANALLVIVPVTGLCLYLTFGSPERPDMPLEARLENPGDDLDLMLAKVERHLAQNPNDVRGWDVVAPVYFAASRWDDAQNAFRTAIRLDGENVARLTGLGEALINANDGIVVGEARALFERVIIVEPSNPRAQYYTALAAQQSGRQDEAKRLYQQLLDSSEPNAPWLSLVKEQLAKLGAEPAAPSATAPSTTSNEPAVRGPSAQDVAAAEEMSGDDRQAMINSMVEGLQERLNADPNNIDGWLQLLRSYSVLGDKDKAQTALETALKTFAPSSENGKRLLDAARALQLNVSGAAQ